MAVVRAYINHKTLALARKEAGYQSVLDAAPEFYFSRKTPQRLAAMEAGKDYKSRPTLRQIKNIARVYGIDEWLLRLPPEQARLQLPDIGSIRDFRDSRRSKRKTPELVRLLREVMTRQQLLRQVLDEKDVTDLSWIGAYSGKQPEQIAQDLRRMIWQDKTPETRPRAWIDRAEKYMEVAVIQPHNYSVKDQLSGIAIDNDRVPAVVINADERPEIRLFTLLHELAHLMINAPGISKVDSESGYVIPACKREERICEAVAVNVLIPQGIFNELWKQHLKASENIEHLGNKTGASAAVCAITAYRRKQIDRGTMTRLLKIYKEKHQEKQERDRAARERRVQKGEPDSTLSQSLIARDNIGSRMTLKSLLAYDEKRISARELYYIFGVKLRHLADIADRVNYKLVRRKLPSNTSLYLAGRE